MQLKYVQILFSVLVYRYPVNAYLLGQFIPFSLACLIGAWWGLANRQPAVATVALLMAMVRPETVIFPVLALLVLAWGMGHRRVVIGWGLGMGLIWLLTRMWIGPWETDFLEGLSAYQSYSFPVWPPGLLGHTWLAVLLLAAVACWGTWLWIEFRLVDYRERLGLLLSTTVLAGLIVFLEMLCE